MGRLLLCNAKKAKTPYFIKNMNLNLYTLEELCYFLYDNLYWIDETIVNDELEEWILKELQLQDLIEELKLNRKSVKSFVMTILTHTGYISKTDMEEAGEMLSKLEDQSELDKALSKASHLLQSKLYREAILEYKKLARIKDSHPLLEKIYNNMGVAYSGLFLYKEATDCFKKAYEQSENQDIYKNLMYAVAMMPSEEALEVQIKLQDNYKEVFQKDMQNAISGRENKKLTQLKAVMDLKKENKITQYYDGLEKILYDWKKEYMNYTG